MGDVRPAPELPEAIAFEVIAPVAAPVMSMSSGGRPIIHSTLPIDGRRDPPTPLRVVLNWETMIRK